MSIASLAYFMKTLMQTEIYSSQDIMTILTKTLLIMTLPMTLINVSLLIMDFDITDFTLK
jgi:hypothetical protein